VIARSPSPRIVSLIASGTEIVAELGFADCLVGVSHECDFPPFVADLPRLTRPKVDAGASSAEIDERVRTLAETGEAAYALRGAALERLRPDLIVTQDVCDVCAVAVPDVGRMLARLDLPGTEVCTLDGIDLPGVLEDFRRVARALGAPERGRRLAERVEGRLVRASARASARVSVGAADPTGTEARPRMAFIEWLAPPMIGGGWFPELVRAAGCEPVLADRPGRFEQIGWPDVATADPDYVVIAPCGFGVRRSLAELDDPAVARALLAVPAVRDGRCIILDGHAYFNRPGPRLAEGVEVLAALVHDGTLPAEDLTVELPAAWWDGRVTRPVLRASGAAVG